MKREFFIAIVLLAAGGALWAGQNGGLNRMIQLTENWFQGVSKSQSDAFLEFPENDQAKVRRFSSLQSYLEDFRSDHLNKTILIPDLSSVSTSSQAHIFLEGISANLKNSEPFTLDLKIWLNWNQAQLAFAGTYSQMGQGSGQSRTELEVSGSSSRHWITKVRDGRFLYELHSFQNQQQLRFVDLQRIQEARTRLSKRDINTDFITLEMGELANLLEQLSAYFQWNSPELTETDEQNFCQLEGTWRPELIQQLLRSEVPQHYLEPNVVWHKLPPQIPHQVQISLRHQPNFGWMVKRIVFFRFVKSKSQPDTLDDGTRLAQIFAVFELSSVQPFDGSAEELVQIDSQEIETRDDTELYLNQLKKFAIERTAE